MSYFQALTLKTDYGDMKIELFCEETPKACEVYNLKLDKHNMIWDFSTLKLISGFPEYDCMGHSKPKAHFMW